MDRVFKKEGENIHQRMQDEIFKKDKFIQQQMYQQFTQEPKDFRERMQRIEAGSMGFKIEEDILINTKTNQPATQEEAMEVEKATDDAMLRQNPDLIKYNLKYDGQHFIPIGYSELLERVL